MNEERTGKRLRQMENIRAHFVLIICVNLYCNNTYKNVYLVHQVSAAALTTERVILSGTIVDPQSYRHSHSNKSEKNELSVCNAVILSFNDIQVHHCLIKINCVWLKHFWFVCTIEYITGKQSNTGKKIILYTFLCFLPQPTLATKLMENMEFSYITIYGCWWRTRHAPFSNHVQCLNVLHKHWRK